MSPCSLQTPDTPGLIIRTAPAAASHVAMRTAPLYAGIAEQTDSPDAGTTAPCALPPALCGIPAPPHLNSPPCQTETGFAPCPQDLPCHPSDHRLQPYGEHHEPRPFHRRR